jgi:uncharacterized protein YegP (UPF0339 family)
MYFEIVKNKKEEFVLVLRAKNGEVIVKTEGYVSKAHAKKIATKILDLKPETEVRDLTIAAKAPKVDGKSPAKKPAAKKAVKAIEAEE